MFRIAVIVLLTTMGVLVGIIVTTREPKVSAEQVWKQELRKIDEQVKKLPSPKRQIAFATDCIEIKQSQLVPSSPKFFNLVGEIVNRCSHAAGVKLKVTLRDVNGRVVGDHEFWPMSMENLMPSQFYPFTYLVSATTDQVPATHELYVISTRPW
jgi:hypothetical protein